MTIRAPFCLSFVSKQVTTKKNSSPEGHFHYSSQQTYKSLFQSHFQFEGLNFFNFIYLSICFFFLNIVIKALNNVHFHGATPFTVT